MKNDEKKCVIYYKTGWLSSRMCLGETFDSLDHCCITFSRFFFNTGNKKSSEFGTGNAYATDNTGLNFIKMGGELKLILIGEPINFCPWCGSRIEIKKMKDVTLEPKTKEIPDGYKEIEEVMT